MCGGVTRRVGTVLLVASVAVGSGGGSVRSSPAGVPGPQLQAVRVVLSSPSMTNSGLYVADGRGYFEQQSIRVEFLRVRSASETMNLLSTNRIDVADVGINPALFNGIAAHLGFKVVADKGAQLPGFGSTALVVRKDLAQEIKGPTDLKGRTIAMTPPGLATANGFALAAYLKRANLTPADVHIRPIPFPEQVAALSNKAVEAAIMAEPFVATTVREGIGVRFIGLDEIVPGQQVAALAYSSQFIRERGDLARAFMVAYVKGIRDYNAAIQRNVDRRAILEILAKALHMNDMTIWESMKPAGLNPDGKVNEASIAQAKQFFLQQRLIREGPPVSSFVDNSFVRYAVQVLGPARIP